MVEVLVKKFTLLCFAMLMLVPSFAFAKEKKVTGLEKDCWSNHAILSDEIQESGYDTCFSEVRERTYKNITFVYCMATVIHNGEKQPYAWIVFGYKKSERYVDDFGLSAITVETVASEDDKKTISQRLGASAEHPISFWDDK